LARSLFIIYIHILWMQWYFFSNNFARLERNLLILYGHTLWMIFFLIIQQGLKLFLYVHIHVMNAMFFFSNNQQGQKVAFLFYIAFIMYVYIKWKGFFLTLLTIRKKHCIHNVYVYIKWKSFFLTFLTIREKKLSNNQQGQKEAFSFYIDIHYECNVFFL
jgi:hypothetical protein